MQPAGSGRAGAADATFIRDGFSWLAFLLPPLWLLWHRLWIAAVLALIALVLAAGARTGTGVGRCGAAGLAARLDLRRARRQCDACIRAQAAGWRSWGVHRSSADLDDAETRYAAAISSDDSTVTDEAPIQPSANSGPASPAPGTPIGLLLNPGR